MNIYEVARAQGFEFTGEYRKVKLGEWYLGSREIVRWPHADFDTLGEYLVLRKIKRTFEFDGQVFECPEGYVFERVGCPTVNDVGKFIMGGLDGSDPCELRPYNIENFAKITYFIFRKEPK